MGIRNDWWHKEFALGDPAAQMGGLDGTQGIGHPTHTWFTEYVPAGSSVLDVGCCNAHTLECFIRASKDITYVGVDHLEEVVDYCRAQYPAYSFLQSDAADLQDFGDNSMDYVLSRHVYEHLNHYSQHFMEMWRVAKKEVIIIGFLELKHQFDRLQYGIKQDGKTLPHWYNQYGIEQMEQFIQYNITKNYQIIPDRFGIGHPIIILKKEQG